MGKTTGIAWCDATFNTHWGCSRVSPACAHCYADTLAARFGHPDLWPRGSSSAHEFRFFGEKHWNEPLKWARLAREGMLPDGSPNLDGHRPRVFCASMADVFEERYELDEVRLQLFDLIIATPELDWLLLTKRPEFARDWLNQYREALDAIIATHMAAESIATFLLPNVWMGVSIENARYTWRADVLREIPAAVRFISVEPLLGSLYPTTPAARRRASARPLDLTGIDWVIIGGESGPRARPFRLDHAREIIQAARDRDVVCCQNPPAECCGRPYDSGECCGQPVQGSECCGNFEQPGPGPAVFVKQLGARPVESGVRYAAQVAIPIECEHGYDVCPQCDASDVELKLRDRMGSDWDEWPADLKIREFPTVTYDREKRAA